MPNLQSNVHQYIRSPTATPSSQAASRYCVEARHGLAGEEGGSHFVAFCSFSMASRAASNRLLTPSNMSTLRLRSISLGPHE